MSEPIDTGSEPIDTGARRRVRTLSKPRTDAVDRRRKIDRSKDELDLGRFTGKADKDAGPTSQTARDELDLGRFSGGAGEDAPPKTRGASELELGRFTGKVKGGVERAPAKQPSAPDKDGVLGPKRRKVVSDSAKAKRRRVSAEMEIASTRDTSENAEPGRPLAKKRRRTADSGRRHWIRRASILAVSALLTALTAAIFLLMPRYQPVGDPLIADPAFAGGAADWRHEGLISWDADDPSKVTLERINLSARTFLTKDIALPPGDNLLILRAQVQGENIVPGPEDWDQARAYLGQVTAGGDVKWEEDHILFLLNGSTELRNYSRAYSIPEEIRTVRLGIELKDATGSMTIHHLRLDVAERPTAFLVAAGFLLVGWGLLVPYVAYRTFRGISSTRIRIALGVACVLSAIGLLVPGFVYEGGVKELGHSLGFETLDLDPVGHGVIFTLLPLLVRLGRRSEPVWLHAGAWLLIGVASEVLQLFSVDREPSFEDLALDSVAILVGLTLAEIMNRMPRSSAA
ncbi:MAG: VanZ family protein [Alphaproteobacteria bacterium]